MSLLEPIDTPEITDRVLSNLELDDLLDLRLTGRDAKAMVDTRLRRMYLSKFNKMPTGMEMKSVISKLKNAYKEYWVFEGGNYEEFCDYYIFHGSRRQAYQQWAMLTLARHRAPWLKDDTTIKTFREYVYTLYHHEEVQLSWDEWLDSLPKEGLEHVDDFISYSMNVEFPKGFSLPTEMYEDNDVKLEIPDRALNRYVRENAVVMRIDKFFEKGLWPPESWMGNVYRLSKPIPFGYDREVNERNIEFSGAQYSDYERFDSRRNSD